MMSQTQRQRRPEVEPCSECGMMLGVDEAPLFSKVRCPNCRAEVRVRKTAGLYFLSGVLGHGGSGRVFRARRMGEDHDIALKVIEKGVADYGDHLLLMRNEAAAVAVSTHPRIVRILSLEEDDEGARLSMELMEGGSLHDLISDMGRVGEERALRITLDVLEGLSASHDRGIVHRDLKPANILFTASGGAKIADFGLALSTRSKPVARTHLLATPDYVSPEILGGFRGDVRSDIYGLGGCLYHALTGHPPHATEGLCLRELRAIKSKAPRLPKSVFSSATRHLLERMIHPDPSRRFRDGGELAAALRASLETLSMEDSRRWSVRCFLGGLASRLLSGHRKRPPAR